MRVISKWHNTDTARGAADVANTLGFNVWKIAYKAIKSMQDERLYFVSELQGLLVVAEFMMFQIQIVDRLAFNRMELKEREHFMQALASRCLEILAENRVDLQGEGGYRGGFLEIMNSRLRDYSEFSFSEDTGPGYQFYRYLGEKIGKLMGNDQDNKWAIDQVIEIEAPDVYDSLRNSVDMLL